MFVRSFVRSFILLVCFGWLVVGGIAVVVVVVVVVVVSQYAIQALFFVQNHLQRLDKSYPTDINMHTARIHTQELKKLLLLPKYRDPDVEQNSVRVLMRACGGWHAALAVGIGRRVLFDVGIGIELGVYVKDQVTFEFRPVSITAISFLEEDYHCDCGVPEGHRHRHKTYFHRICR